MRSKRYNESRCLVGSDVALRYHLAKRNRATRQTRKVRKENKGNE
jgi:hypothetical protein